MLHLVFQMARCQFEHRHQWLPCLCVPSPPPPNPDTALESTTAAGLCLEAVIGYQIPCESVLRTKELKKLKDHSGSWQPLSSLLPRILESTPVPIVLCGDGLFSRGHRLCRTFKGNRQKMHRLLGEDRGFIGKM